jgi:hypothetical protein
MLPELTEFVPAIRMRIDPVSNLKRKRHSKALRRSEKMHPARFSRPKSTFLTILILIAGTNSVSSGNIVEESFFDKIVADKLKVKLGGNLEFSWYSCNILIYCSNRCIV